MPSQTTIKGMEIGSSSSLEMTPYDEDTRQAYQSPHRIIPIEIMKKESGDSGLQDAHNDKQINKNKGGLQDCLQKTELFFPWLYIECRLCNLYIHIQSLISKHRINKKKENK